MPKPTRLGQPTSLDDVLLYRLSRLLSTGGSMVIRLCEGSFGITRREWRLIARLAQQGELLSSELAESAQLDRARTSKAITSLVGKKLVHRQVRPGDRRKAVLALTDAGRALHEALYPLVLEINSDLLACLPDADVAALDGALDALQARAQKLVEGADLPKADRRRGGTPRARMG
jgi:DNA-binding MarR family transcriptional regulator